MKTNKVDESFTETTGTVARSAGCLPALVRKYADENLIEFQRMADGTRAFQKSAAEKVRALKAQRIAGKYAAMAATS